MRTGIAIVCMAVAAGTAAADDRVPRSLRMRVAELPPAAPPPDDAPAPAPAPDDAPAAPAPESPADEVPPEDGNTEVIVVTGSNIEHDLLTGRAPTSVVTRADLDASGRATLGEILQAIPAQANAGNAQVNRGGDGASRINLRGLGAPRTVVLLNGRRLTAGGAGADAAVDLNVIPLALIERVEIVKDGASAIYGSDAVAGVVNIITHPQFSGTDVALLTSTSLHGDGFEYDASVVRGFTTADERTYLVLSGSYQAHRPVFAGDRAFAAFQKSYDFASQTEVRNRSLVTPTGRLDVSSLGAGIQIPGCASAVCTQTGDGGWRDFVAPDDVFNDAAADYLYTPASRANVFFTGGRKFGAGSAMFVEFLYQRRTSSRALSAVPFVADAVISKDSLYNPFGVDLLDYRRRITELGPRQYLDDVAALRLVVGVKGVLPAAARRLEGWKYELSLNFGETKAGARTTGQLYKTQLADALGPSMLDADGVPICVRTPGDPSTRITYGATTVPCVPLNLLAGPGAIPRDQLRRLSYDDGGYGDSFARTLLATTSGRVAALPHRGDISLAVGTDYRFERGSHAPPAIASTGGSTDSAAQPTDGERAVTEAFGELAIVPITGHAIARRVELDLGARVVHQTGYGTRLTYKAGGLVRTVRDLAVRATYATGFRAPGFFDLYGGRTEQTPAAEDPCDTAPPSVGDGTRALDPGVQARCTAQGVPVGSAFGTGQQIAAIGGNPALAPETAATATVGVVLEPIEGLRLSADYWHITIRDAIETLGIHTIFANCYARGVQGFCDQIHRDPGTHRISAVDQLLQNVTRTTTSGIDLAIGYDAAIGARGRIRTALEAQRLLRYDLVTAQQVIHGVGVYDLGVFPRYKANLSSTWVHPRAASAGFSLRFVGAYQECAGNDCNTAATRAGASRAVTAYAKLDLFGGYDLRSRIGKTTVQVGLNNVFDAAPPVVYNAAAANSDATAYDFVGRMVYARVSQQF